MFKSGSHRGGTQCPQKKKGSQEKKTKGEVVPPNAPITAAI